jgi:hypothetical protein
LKGNQEKYVMEEESGINITDSKVEEGVKLARLNGLTLELPLVFKEDPFDSLSEIDDPFKFEVILQSLDYVVQLGFSDFCIQYFGNKKLHSFISNFIMGLSLNKLRVQPNQKINKYLD